MVPNLKGNHVREADSEDDEEEDGVEGDDDVIPGKGRLHGGDEGWRRPPRPKSGRGRKGGENAMLRAVAEGDITTHRRRHYRSATD